MSLQQQAGHEPDCQSPENIQINKVLFDQLFKNNFTRLCLQCQYKYAFDLDLAKEVVHTAFIKLWETRYQCSPGFAVKPYLDKIITNNCLDVLKHEKVKDRYKRMIMDTSEQELNSVVFHTDDLKEMTAEINRAIGALPEQMRKVFELSRYEGLKYSTIAAQLDLSIKTVETQMSRALQKLRQSLAHHLPLLFAISSLLQKIPN